MTATIRLGLVSGVIALGVLFSAATPAFADCTRGAPPHQIAAYRGYAFMATVARISKLHERQGHIAITFAVERTFAGPANRQVTIRDHDGTCGMLFAWQMSVGQRVVVSTDALAKWRDNTIGYALMWKPAGPGHWRLFEDALYWGHGSSYPAEAYGDLTTVELASLVSGLPPTDGVLTAGDDRFSLPILVSAFVVAGWLSLRLRPRRAASQ